MQIVKDVYPLAKIRILKQITTQGLSLVANAMDVYPLAKIRILKQITTGP